ncbi:peptidylprolyl isomerase [Pelagibacterales bacterium SAG-MED23]|nr:peptidylprolyl isomerase [Pelagibacterales bacterium SAG-MED23]
MNKIKFLLIFFIFFSICIKSQSNIIKIEIVIQNEIITNIDVEEEQKYLLYLNPKLKNLKNIKVKEIATNSLITEIIKKKELEKFHDFKKLDNFSNTLEDKFLNNKNISKSEFKQILNEKNLSYKTIRKKLQIEALWNQFIYNKYIKNIKIDKKYLRERLLKQYKENNIKYEYSLSEIFFTENINDSLQDTYEKISTSINEIGFENTANIYSSSETSKNGGLIGWINELQISESIKKNIINLDVGMISKPVKIRGGYLLIKINNKREFKQEIDIEKELKDLQKKEINRQLNAFSIIFYKRLKKNIKINEL